LSYLLLLASLFLVSIDVEGDGPFARRCALSAFFVVINQCYCVLVYVRVQDIGNTFRSRHG
jgi:hypothetical protein